MNEIKKRSLDGAIRVLKAIGATFAIQDSDGNTFFSGDTNPFETTKEVARKSKKRHLVLPFGAIAAHMNKYINPNQIKVGDVVEVPCIPGTTLSHTHSNVINHVYKTFGPSNVKTCQNRKTMAVEILRVA